MAAPERTTQQLVEALTPAVMELLGISDPSSLAYDTLTMERDFVGPWWERDGIRSHFTLTLGVTYTRKPLRPLPVVDGLTWSYEGEPWWNY